MKKLMALAMVGLLTFSLAACGGKKLEEPKAEEPAKEEAAAPAEEAGDDFEEMVVSFATANGVAQTIEKMDQNWMAYVTEKSGGKITFDYYPGAQLGSYMELIEQVNTGAINVSVTDISMFESYCPEFSVLYFPYIMNDSDHAGKVMYGEGGEILKKALADQTETYMLGFVQHGARVCATTTAINAVEDCKGIIMRTPEAQNYIKWCDTIGMSSTAMAMSEAYTAIQTGVAQGIELPIQALQSNGYTDVAPNVWKDAHMYAFQGLTVNQAWFDSLPQNVQDLFVEAWEVQQDDYNAVFRLNKGIFTVAGSENVVPVELLSNGKQDISNIEYSVEINGKTETKTADIAIPGGFRKSGKVNVAFTSPTAIEPYNIKLTIDKVNGQENTNKTPLYIYGDNVTRKAPYKALVEEYTGTNCGWCPRGWVGMEAIKNQLSDISVPIAVHQYNNTDPMLIDEKLYAALPVEGAPSAVINRDSGIDPYYGTYDDVDFGILQDVKDLASTVSPVDINVKAIYNEDQTKVETTAEVEFLSNSGTYSVEYVLTADALKGTSSAWRQRNYYYNHLTSDYDIDLTSELVDFCIGGKYGKEFVFITFNDVAIASSYENYLNTEMPIDFVAGDKFTDTFTLKMPTKAALKSAIQKDQVYANVMVFDENGYCVNAARVRVLTQEEAAGIKNHTATSDHTSAIYNLAGQRVTGNYRGIVIQNGRKAIVR